jgi:regulator of protease activity HflC (stomatin/prohibitin superfamily)
MDSEVVAGVSISAVIGILLIVGIGGALYGCPRYNVYNQRLTGEAELARAESNRKIAVAEAEAKKESAKQLADAEVIRAEGVAKANKIIGDSLKNNEAYLRYLYITGITDNNATGNQTIYIPTEAGLPILEATRRFK